jgi:predicted RNA methylase
MATDVAAVFASLLGFYEFDNKIMVSVGAGGGQLAGYGRIARKVITVDPDDGALAVLADRTRALGIEDRFVLVENDFMVVSERADVVLLEFCLHEISDHGGALAHAATPAADTVVIDHASRSPWAHNVNETEEVAASWAEVAARGMRRKEDFDVVQRFASDQELFDKAKGRGAEAIRRIERWRGCADITIPMAYAFALL